MTEQALQKLMAVTSRLRLLYVEDNASARESTMDILKDFFSKVTIAENGKEGLQKYFKGDFDLIISDINMPLMNGIDMTAKIREDNSDIPILILSAHDESSYLRETIKLGVEGYLLKPIDIDQFLDLLTRVSRQIQNAHENRDYKYYLEYKISEKTKELRYAYSHDDLTKLENSVKLDEALRSNRYDYLILLHIYDFTLIKKEYGHLFSNEIIYAVSKDLLHHTDEESSLFKMEADRFVFMLSRDDRDEVEAFCNRLIDYFNHTSIEVRDNELSIELCMGITKIIPDSDPVTDAEYALEECRSTRRYNYSFYEFDEQRIADRQDMLRWLNVTKIMIMNEMIEPYFQPIKEIETGRILKYEVLARGMFEDQIILPEHFLIPAERLGLTSHITKLMVEKSFAFFQGNDLDFSINISERDLLEDYLTDYMSQCLKKYAIDPKRVTFEVLENIAIRENSEIIVEQIKALQTLGLQIAVDDFGVEHSNFKRLLDINIDVIKIDGVFIKRIGHDEKGKQIVRAIVSLAQTLGVKTVAEYVESKEIYDLVKECGIDFAQGYHIGRPHHTTLEG